MKQFQVPDFLYSSNLYEVNLRQYTPEGTIRAFMLHLPRLKEMGVQILWMMPVFPIGHINRKGSLGSYYSIKDFEDINPEFGTQEDFHAMVKMVHSLGMKVILDWVANHAAWDNKWTIHNPAYFVRDENKNFLTPYDWTDVIQIDHSNEIQQHAMIGAMEFWIKRFDIDGFRADLAHLTPLNFWIKARKQLEAIKHDLIWLAETETNEYYEAFDITFAWKWMHATEEVAKQKQQFHVLKDLLAADKAATGKALRMFFTSNHDENSWNGTEFEKYGIFAKALAVFACTYLYSVPLVYTGQELPVTRRLSFFDKDSIVWTEPALHSFYNTLLSLRRASSVFHKDALLDFEEAGHLIAYSITSPDRKEQLKVYLNLSHDHGHCNVSVDGDKSYTEVFSGKR